MSSNQYDENGKALISSKGEIEEAKYRVKLKREIRKKIPRASWFSIRNLPTNVLEKLV